jgi:hypothetical protein
MGRQARIKQGRRTARDAAEALRAIHARGDKELHDFLVSSGPTRLSTITHRAYTPAERAEMVDVAQGIVRQIAASANLYPNH